MTYSDGSSMSELTLHAPPSRPTPVPAPGGLGRRRWVWWAVAALVVGVSVALTSWARTRPGFDPYGWLTWGRMTLHGGLDTNAAPSWKPLPYLFTVLYGLLGRGAAMHAWLVSATASALGGVVFAGRLANRLTAAPADRRWAGWVAAAFAGAALLGLRDELGYSYFHYFLSAQSDPMVTTLVLAAIDCHLGRRPRWAFALGALAALARPEVWPFLGLYTVWLWRTHPRARWLVAVVAVALVLLWFGIPALTSRSWFVAGDNANGSGRAPSGDRVTAVIRRFLHLHHWPLEVAALLGVALAAARRAREDLVVLALAAGVVVWVAIEIAFALHGWPGLGRYMFEPAAVMIVIAGVFVGRALSGSPFPAWAGAAAVIALFAALVPAAISSGRDEHRDIIAQRHRTAEIDALPGVIARIGGAARVRACGESLTRLEYQTMLAFTIGENVNRIGFKYGQAVAHGNPIILFTPAPTGVGWTVQAMHETRSQCRSLPAARSSG